MAGRPAPSVVPRRNWTRTPGALVLGVAGATLIALDSAWILLFGGTLPTWLSLGPSLVFLGAAGLVEAALLAVAAVYAYLHPRHHTALGVAMITLALLALQSGGGLYLGTLLGYVGGIVAVAHRPATGAESLERVDLDAVRRDPVLEADLLRSGFRLSDEAPGSEGPSDGAVTTLAPGAPPGPAP